MAAADAPWVGPRWRPRAYGPAGLAALTLVLFVVAVLSVRLAPQGSQVAPWWPAAALSVLALAWAPRRLRPTVAGAIAGATLLANLAGGRTLGPALGLAASNTAEALVVAWLLVGGVPGGRPRLTTHDDVVRLMVATLAGIAVMGVGAGATVALTGTGEFTTAARTVVASHGAAILLLVPFGTRLPATRPDVRPVETVAQWATLLSVVVLVFRPGQALPLSFLVLPVLVWGAFRLAPRAVTAQVVVLAVLVGALTASGGGPYAHLLGAWTPQTISFLQAYLVSCALVALPLAVTTGQRRADLEQLAASERLFRLGFSDALLGMLLLRRCDHVDLPGHGDGALDVVELNDVAARLLRRPAAELTGTSWTSSLAPADRATVADQVHAMARGTSTGWHGEMAVSTADGTRWVEVALSPLGAAAGDGLFAAQLVDVTSRREAEDRLAAQALEDGLTGLANRRLLRVRLESALEALPDDGAGVAVLFCDLDDFKHVNDSAGHSVGDDVLVEVAARLTALLLPDDVAGRLGGDEFVVLRPHATSAEEAEELASRLLGRMAEPVVVGGQVIALGVSIGIAWGVRGVSADDVLRDADSAMYAAKAEGKRRAVVFSDEHRARALRELRIEAELRTALALDQLEIHLQPVVDLLDERVVAAEALVRWRHPEHGLLLPGEWLDVAERTGLMPAIGRWVLERSCALAAGWPAGPSGPPPAVHVNVSARQLDRPGFVDDVHQVLARTGLPAGRLVLEFTETHLDQVSDALVRELAALRDEGIGLAADDYGTGYSPLTRIVDLPLTMVKVDRRFVTGMLSDERSRAVVRSLVRLSESLDLELVAEGVETPAQAIALRQLGCPHGQGFLWSHALEPEEFVAALRA